MFSFVLALVQSALEATPIIKAVKWSVLIGKHFNSWHNVMIFKILYSQKYWRSLNLAVWAPYDVFHTIQDLNLVVWYGIAIVHARGKNFGGF